MPPPTLTATHLSTLVSSAAGELTILHELSLQLTKRDTLPLVAPSRSGQPTLLGLRASRDLPIRIHPTTAA
ncbi:hypothetical protein B1218_33525 [Pseudomonas ogarae]|nr:hypothetical protein B1218_33525 [Pseudomonas ogarae]